MASQLERRIAQFTDWRTKLVAATDEFRSWQDTYGHADIEQTLRIYDLVEGLRNAVNPQRAAETGNQILACLNPRWRLGPVWWRWYWIPLVGVGLGGLGAGLRRYSVPGGGPLELVGDVVAVGCFVPLAVKVFRVWRTPQGGLPAD